MLSTSPRRLLRRTLSLTFAVLAAGCSDTSSSPLAPLGGPARFLVAPAIIVTNTDDAGAGSLRQAVLDAPDGATIQFDASIAGQTIVLSTGAIVIEKVVTIEGPSTLGMTVSGGLKSRIFTVNTTAEAVFRNLSIVNGRDEEAGAIRSTGRITVDHSLIANNEATLGPGGIDSDGNFLTLVNSTVTGNVGFAAIRTYHNAIIRNSTIAGNTGTGLYNVGNATLRNTIIANNTAPLARPAATNCDLSGGVNTYVGANMSNDASCGADPSLLIADPKLGPLANNGGPTRTMALLGGSPAIDAGLLCTEATDQRYVTRDKGLSCDLGAFEFENFTAIELTVGPNVAVNPRTGVATVTGTVTCAAPTTVGLSVTLSQEQKVTGRFTTIVEATGATSVNCTGTSSWTATLEPQVGKFEVGSATATSSTTTVTGGSLPATVTASVKVYAAK